MIHLYKTTERKVDTIINNIPVCGSQKGAGTWCVITSILFSECNCIEPIQLLKKVSTLKDADTDTLACILGGILGLSLNIPVNYFKDIKDINYITNEIRDFQTNIHSINIEFLTKKNLKDKLRKLEVGQSLVVSPFGQVTLIEIEELESLSSTVRSYLYKFSTQLGQTLTALQFKKC